MDPYIRITLVYAAFSFALMFTDPVFAIFLTQKGFDPIWLTIILSSFSATTILVSPLIGGISDTWGRRPLILGGILLYVIALSLFVFASHPLLIFIGRMIEAIAYTSVSMVVIAKLEDIMAERKQKKTGGDVGLSLSISKIGHVTGPLVGAAIAAAYGIEWAFYASIMLLGLVGVAYYFARHRIHPKPPFEKLTFNPVPAWNEYIKVKPFRGLAVLEIAFQFTMPAMFVFLPLYITQNLGLGLEYVGMAFLVKESPQLLQFIAGKLTDAWGSKRVMVIGNTLCAAAMVAMSTITTFDYLLVALFAYGVGTSMLGISSISLLSGIAEKVKREATFLGSHVSISKIGALVGYLVSGIIVELASIPALFVVSGIIIFIGVVVAEEWLTTHTFSVPTARRLVAVLFHRH